MELIQKCPKIDPRSIQVSSYCPQRGHFEEHNREAAKIFPTVWKKQWVTARISSGHCEKRHWWGHCPKNQKLLTSLLVYIPISWDPEEEWTATGETSLGTKTAGMPWCTMPDVSVYHESSWPRSNWKIFESVGTILLVSHWVCLPCDRVNETDIAFIKDRYSVITLVHGMKRRMN